MARQLSAWNKFVKSVFQSEKKKNPKCTFAEALKKASQLKKSGKMKGGLVTNEGDSGLTDSGLTDSGLTDSGLSNSGDVSSSSTPFSASGMTTPQNTPVTSSLMSGGKTRKRKSGKSKKSKKSRKSRKSRKSKK